MAHRFQLRGRTSAEAAALNEVLLDREICIETDTMLYKIGDGATAWNALPYRQIVGEFAAAIMMDAVANPAAPGAGKLAMYAHDIAGRIVPKWIGPSGLDNPVQSEIGVNRLCYSIAGSGASLSVVGMGALTVVGTLAHPAIVAGVNLRNSIARATVTSVASANAASGLRQTSFMCYRGEQFGAAKAGGFYFRTRFGVSSAVALQRCLVGLIGITTAFATTLNPSSATNCIAVGWDSADTTLQIMHNDASGACTKISLGADFPSNNTNAVYELVLFCPPNGDTVGWRVTRLDTEQSVSGLITTDLPVKSQLLTYHAYANNGGTAAAVVLDFISVKLESDF